MKHLLFYAVSIIIVLGFGLMSEATQLPSDPFYSNAPGRSIRLSATQPRTVTNFLGPQYRTYIRAGGANWLDFPANTPTITWGNATPTFTVTSAGTAAERAFAFASFNAIAGQTYILSFYVDAKNGTLTDSVLFIAGVSTVGSTLITNPALGRHVMKFVPSATGTGLIRLGIGTYNGEPSHVSSITISKVMLEIPIDGSTRTYPYEYVHPNDTRLFPYTFTASPIGDLVGTETKGNAFAYRASQSVLVIGDSFTNDRLTYGLFVDDFPFYMDDYLQFIMPHAVASRGAPGQMIGEITTQLVNAMSETTDTYTSGVAPWKTLLIEGGVNDVNNGHSLVQMQTDRLAQLTTAQSYGFQNIVIMNICPFNSGNGAMQTIIASFNAWLPSLGFPVYDCFGDMSNGANQWRTDAVTPDGTHPGVGYMAGAYQIARRLSLLLSRLP